MLTERKKLALSGSLALALGLIVGVAVDGSEDKPTRDARHEAIGSAIAAGSAVGSASSSSVDSKAYHEAVIDIRSDDPNAIDLLTGIVEPGAEVKTGVNIPEGRRVSPTVEYVGPHASSFSTVSITYRDDKDRPTWVELRARNNGATPARLSAFVYLEAAP